MEEILEQIKTLRYAVSQLDMSTGYKFFIISCLNLIYEMIKFPDNIKKHQEFFDKTVGLWWAR